MYESKRRANKRYRKTHKTKIRIITYRSMAKSFIRRYATKDDLYSLRILIDKKLNNRE